MITLTARISLLNSGLRIQNHVDDFKEFGTYGDNIVKYGNNISTQDLPVNTKVKGSNPFILGSSKLGNGTTFSNKVNYAISRQLSNEEGVFEKPFKLYIHTSSGVKFNYFSIAFDSINNKHPKSILVDGYEYVDNDPIFFIDCTRMYSNGGSYVITIDNWNTPNSPLVITGIYLDIEIEIDKKSLISLESSIFERSDTKLPSYGIISNTGNLEFNDLDGEIRDYAEQMLLQSGLKVQLNLKDTLTKKERLVGLLETAQWNYDNDNRVVSVSLKDDLEEWQDIQIKGFNYDPRNPKAVLPNQTLADLYKWLQDPKNTPTKYNMLSFDKLNAQTQYILNDTYLPYPLLKDGTLWEQWTKICQVCGLYIYKNEKGQTICSF